MTRRAKLLPTAMTMRRMRFFVDGFAIAGRFDKLSPEARLGVMQNAGFFRMMTRSENPYPDTPRRTVAKSANTCAGDHGRENRGYPSAHR